MSNIENSGINDEFNSLEAKLNASVAGISTKKEWKEYIDRFYPRFCELFAKREIQTIESGTAKTRPIAIITGGQPGAGKSQLLPKYKEYLKEKYGIDAVLNNADFYRFCVPGSYRIAQDFPESASQITDPVVKAMRKNLIEEAIKQKQSIIIENTLGDTITVDMLRNSNTHDISLALMAVAREESLLSDFERYIKMKKSCDVARLVSIEAHDKRYNALNEIAPRLEKEGIRIMVHSRGKTESEYPIKEYDSADNSSRTYRNVTDAMGSLRRRSFQKGVENYPSRLAIIREKMTEYGMTPEEAEELKKLEDIINRSIDKISERGGREDD